MKTTVYVVIFTTNTDGPAEWQMEEAFECTEAIFVYNGVQYHFYGRMSHEAMKRFLETLYFEEVLGTS